MLGVVLTMPRWALNVFEVGLEEGYNITALALLFALLWFGETGGRARLIWAATLGSLLVLLLFLKSSMLYWCLAAPVLVGLRHRDFRSALVMLGMVAVGLTRASSFCSCMH